MTRQSRTQERTPLLIFPCNGNGVEAIDCLGDRFRLIGFVDDTPEKQNSRPFGYNVFSRAAFSDFPDAQVLAAPGSPVSFRARAEVIAGLGLNDSRFAQVIHPSARISSLAEIGHNVLIMAGVVLTSNCIIGNHVCVLPNTVIHHDVALGDWSLVGSSVTIAGNVKVGANSYIGSGSCVMNGLKIGSGALLGLGSNVIRDVAPGATVAGNPARQI
jgi:sugar O-acyltransferase (sialic acid O-acetyltransferase NeuD family)